MINLEEILPQSPIEGMGEPKYITVEVYGYGPWANLRVSLDLSTLGIGVTGRIEKYGNLLLSKGSIANCFVDEIFKLSLLWRQSADRYKTEAEEWRLKCSEKHGEKLNTHSGWYADNINRCSRLADRFAYASELLGRVVKEDFRFLKKLGFNN